MDHRLDTWCDRMEECPTDRPILLAYSDGSFRYESAETNDVEWAKHYPAPLCPQLVSPIQWRELPFPETVGVYDEDECANQLAAAWDRIDALLAAEDPA